MIFLFIAGTYTPFALLALPSASANWVLAVVWGGAAGRGRAQTRLAARAALVGRADLHRAGLGGDLRHPRPAGLRRRRGRGVDAGRRAALHGGRGHVRDPAAEPVAGDVRLSRVLPRRGVARGAVPLRRHLAGAVRQQPDRLMGGTRP